MNQLELSFFTGDETDTKPSGTIKGTLQEIAEHFKKPVVAPKNQGYFVRGVCRERKDESLPKADVIVLDGDSSTDNPNSCISPEEMHNFLKEVGISHFIYTTHSHDPVNGKNKFRAVCESPLTCPEQLVATVEKFYSWANHMGCKININVETKRWSQPWFKANVARNRKTSFRFYEWYFGDALTPVTDYHVTKEGEYEYGEDPKYIKALKDIATGESMHTGVIALGNYFASQGVSISFARQFIQEELRRAHRADEDIEARISALNINLKNCYDNIRKRLPAVEETQQQGETCEEELDWLQETAQGERMDERIFLQDNLLGELTQALLRTMWKPNLMTASMAARAVVSYLGGGNYRTEYGDRCNLQQLAIGASGCGKDIVISAPSLVIPAVFMNNVQMLTQLLRGVIKDAGSAEGIDDALRTLGNKHDVLFTKDEMSGLLISAAKGGEQKRGILDYALSMYTRSDDVMPPRALSKRNGQNDVDILLYAPHFNISGTATPEELVKGLTADLISSGNISRLMFFNAGLYEETLVNSVGRLELSPRLVANLRQLIDSTSMTKDSNIHQMPGARKSNPKVVKFAPGVAELCHSEGQIDQKHKGFERAIKNRRIPNAKKLSMIEAMLENPEAPVVSMECIKRHIYLASNSCNFALALFKENIGEGDMDLAEIEVTRTIKLFDEKHPGKWLPRQKLVGGRKCRRIKQTERKQIVEHLKENGILLERLSDTTSSAKEYRYAKSKHK